MVIFIEGTILGNRVGSNLGEIIEKIYWENNG